MWPLQPVSGTLKVGTSPIGDWRLVFEIGSSLREARERRGLELTTVERDTRIRSRYLRALEEERLDMMPGWVYAKGFLRTYADYLGLDGERFVDELIARFPQDEDEAPVPAPRPIRRRRFTFSRPAGLTALGLAAVMAGGLIWVLGMTGGSKPRAAPQPPPPPARPASSVTKPSNPRQPSPVSQPQLADLLLRATRGRCWLEAHAGSRGGQLLFMRTLEQGQSVELKQKRLWIRLGAPTALDATVNGKAVPLPPATPVDVVVTSSGVQAVA